MSRIYTTKQGDMWDGIAIKIYGDEGKINALLSANEQYNSVVVFPSGVRLAVPDVVDNNTAILPPWKRGK